MVQMSQRTLRRGMMDDIVLMDNHRLYSTVSESVRDRGEHLDPSKDKVIKV